MTIDIGSGGADTVSVAGDEVIFGFGQGDEIQLGIGNWELGIDSASSNLKVGNVTISGAKLSAEENIWTLDDNHVAKYGAGKTEGAYLESGAVKYRAATIESELIKLEGVEKLDGIIVADNTVELTADNFSASGISVQSGGSHAFAIFGAGKFFGTGAADNVIVNANDVTLNLGAGDKHN